MKSLRKENIPTRNGKQWTTSCVWAILRNYTYTGNLLLQKTYRKDHITKQKLFNHGEKAKYLIENSHEPIIPLSTFQAVQAEIERRAKRYAPTVSKTTYPFTGKIICANCGKRYKRKTTATGVFWICSTYNTYGKEKCPSKQIPETLLEELIKEYDMDKITAITSEKNNVLIFSFTDNTQAVKRWQDRSRKQSWTEEMKQKAREQYFQRRKQND